MSITTEYLERLTRLAIVGGPVAVHGAGDVVLVAGRIYDARLGMAEALRAARLPNVIAFDLAEGFQPGAALNCAAIALRRAAHAGRPDVGSLDSRAPLSVADAVATLLEQDKEPFGVILHDADLLFAHRDPETLAALARLARGAHRAACVPGDGALAPRNTLVLVSTGAALPPELAGLPELQRLDTGTTTLAERRAVLEILAPDFPDADRLGGPATDSAIEELAVRTAGQPLTRLEQLRRSAVQRGIRIDEPLGLMTAVDGRREPAPQLDAGRLRTVLASAIVGQDHVVEAVVEELSARAASDSLLEPAGSSTSPATLVLLGSPGTGKTELARRLAIGIFGDASHLVTLGRHPRSVGRHDGSLSAAERLAGRGPCVVLVEEFQRAGSDVIDLLMTAFEDGATPTSDRCPIALHDHIVVLTSSVGSEEVAAMLTTSDMPTRDAVAAAHVRALERHLLTPADGSDQPLAALWSRIKDRLLAYDILHAQAIDGLVARFAGCVVVNAAAQWRVELRYDHPALVEGVRNRLGSTGRWDARDVRRAVGRLLHDPLRTARARGAFAEGDTVLVSLREGRLSIDVQGAERAA